MYLLIGSTFLILVVFCLKRTVSEISASDNEEFNSTITKWLLFKPTQMTEMSLLLVSDVPFQRYGRIDVVRLAMRSVQSVHLYPPPLHFFIVPETLT